MPDPFGLGLGGVAVGSGSGGGIALALIDRTAGTNIGNMTASGGLAAAFDGNTSQASTACAVTTASQPSGFVGKTLAAPAIFGRATTHGANNNNGYTNSATNVTLEIYGKTGAAPTTATDGTLIGTITFATQVNESAPRQIISTNTSTAWDHIWLRVRRTNNSDGFMRCAELELYEVVP